MINKKRSIVDLSVSVLLLKGKKSISERIFFDVLKTLKKSAVDLDKSPVSIVNESVNNISPCLKLISKKVGGNVYQIPVSVKEEEDLLMGVRWLLVDVRFTGNKAVGDLLYNQLCLAYKKEGELMKKKDVLYQTAIRNRAFLKLLA